MSIHTTRFPLRGTHPRSSTTKRGVRPAPLSDDEILGLVTAVSRPTVKSGATTQSARPAKSGAAPASGNVPTGSSTSAGHSSAKHARSGAEGASARRIDAKQSKASDERVSARSTNVAGSVDSEWGDAPSEWDAQDARSASEVQRHAEDASHGSTDDSEYDESGGSDEDSEGGDQSSPASHDSESHSEDGSPSPETARVLKAYPELQSAWDAAREYHSVFPTPAAAQDAKTQLDDLDSLFFSGDPAAHAALAARIHALSPEAFHALTQAMQSHAAQTAVQNRNAAADNSKASDEGGPEGRPYNSAAPHASLAESDPHAPRKASSVGAPLAAPTGRTASNVRSVISVLPARTDFSPDRRVAAQNSVTPNSAATQNLPAPTADPRRVAQLAFFHSANSAAVHQVLAAIEAQVAHLLPASASAPTKTRLSGEIFREVSAALGANRQLGHQLRQAFRSGGGDAAHQRAIVALVTGRARQALPSIARRVINEWTHEVVSASHDKLSRQSASAKRVDISGAASSDGVNRRPVSPRDVDYKRLSDADILNL